MRKCRASSFKSNIELRDHMAATGRARTAIRAALMFKRPRKRHHVPQLVYNVEDCKKRAPPSINNEAAMVITRPASDAPRKRQNNKSEESLQ